MSLLYIVMMFAAPAINPTAEYVHANLSFSSLIPNFNVTYFTSLSILVFAVGGCEKISPYVNKVENPSKGFPRGMIALAVMVVTILLGIGRKDGTRGTARRDGGPQTAEPLPELEKVES